MSSVSSKSTDGPPGRRALRLAVSRSALRLQSDQRLVALTRAGSGAAFSVIVERYRGALLAYTTRILGPHEAEDALQQTFLNALAALRRDDRAIELKPWLYRIAHNVALNTVRRSGRHYEQLDDQFDGVPQPPDVLAGRLRVQHLVDNIRTLSARQRDALVAHEFEGRSYEEIARNMGATTPVVRQLVHRARTRLRDACGVLVPGWALRWLVLADMRTAGSERLGEAVTGGAAGAAVLKACAALVATGAIATGAGGLVLRHDARPDRDRKASAPRADRTEPVTPGRETSAPPLSTEAVSVFPRHKHASRRPRAAHSGAPGGEHRLSGADQGRGEGESGQSRTPLNRQREGEPGNTGPGDTHQSSGDVSSVRRGDGSGGGGDSSGDGSRQSGSGGGTGDHSGVSDQPGAPTSSDAAPSGSPES